MKKIIKITLFLLAAFPVMNYGQAPNLGTTANFALFTAAGAFENSGNTIVTGDVGNNVGAFNAFPPGTLIGQKHVADPASVQAAIDVNVAYGFLSAVTCDSVITTTMGNNQVLTAKTYCLGAASVLNGYLFLDGQGNANSVFIFKINGAFSTNVHSKIVLINSASVCNVYWQINGAINVGDSSVLRGTVLANGAISLLEEAELYGRGLSTQGAISLHTNKVNISSQATPTVIYANGPISVCEGDSVVLSGNIGGFWNNGSVTESIVVKTSGNYFATNTASCSGNSNIIHVTIKPRPACSINCTGTLCQGGNASICAASQSGNCYLWNTGSTSSCISTQSGSYTVTVTNNGCSRTCSTTILNNIPACNIIGNNTICTGSTTELCVANISGNTYHWSNGSTSKCITVSQAGTYVVTVSNNGCSKTCSKTVIMGGVAPICTITGNATFCEGTSTSLCGPFGTNYSYLWNTNSVSRCISVTNGGTYTLTVSKGGCSKSVVKTIVKKQAPACTISGNLNPTNGNGTSLCAPIGLSSYYWNTGSIARCINVNKSGIYYVRTTNSYGCSSTCNVYVNCHFRQSLTENDNSSSEENLDVTVYPNPFSNMAVIEFKNSFTDATVVIDLYDFLGNKITNLFTGEIQKEMMNKTTLKADNLPAGIYFIKINNGNQLLSRKLILMK